MLPPQPKKREATDTLPTSLPTDLSENERLVFGLLSVDEPVHIDALLEGSKLRVGELTAALLGLEMRELVRQLPGKCFVRKL